MAIQVYGEPNKEINGHQSSMQEFRRAHEENSLGLINHMLGRELTDPLPPYDPNHEDNKWPLMVHHAEKGELTVGKSIIPLRQNFKNVADYKKAVEEQDPNKKRLLIQANKKELDAALSQGYRLEPFPKPILHVDNPLLEKAEAERKNREQQGQINALTDALNKAISRLDAVEKK